MISMEEAAVAALTRFHKLYESADARDPLLEEIMLSVDSKYWNVTIGFNTTVTEPLSALETQMLKMQGKSDEFPPVKKRLTRNLRTFPVDAQTGELQSMKMVER